MNPRTQSRNTTILPVLIALTLACFALLPTARAVDPPPDGGYPNQNTAEGEDALFSLTTGVDNTAVGFNTLFNNTSGNFNTATGSFALGSLIVGDRNTANGYGALFTNTHGKFNTATGAEALFRNTRGDGNTAYGAGSLFSNTIGFKNTAIGSNALYRNINGFYNTATGAGALLNIGTGGKNTAVGYGAFFTLVSGSFNTALGYFAGSAVNSADNVICIGSVGGANVSNSCFIGNIRGVTTANADAVPVLIDSAGQLGTMSSSRRFKKEIKSMDNASEAIHALKPVTFHYKSDKTGTPQFGLIAEEVAKVNPDLVVRDEKGEIYTVRYEAVNAMLLNEFLKEHRTVQEQGATIARLQKQVETLTAGLQKVSAQLELSKPTAQTVLNN